MATINEITSASSYTGNAGLGGGVSVGITIDPTPIEKMAAFAFYKDRDLYDTKIKQDAQAAKQIAEITAFDINSPLEHYSTALKASVEDIQKFVRENPNALVYGRDPKGFQEMNKKIAKFNTLRQSGTASDAVYNGRKTKIDEMQDGPQKEIEQRRLDLDVEEHFAGGLDKAVGKTLKSTPDLKPPDPMPVAKLAEMTVIQTGPNKDALSNLKVIDMDAAWADVHLKMAGVGVPPIDETTPYFKSLSPKRQQLERDAAKLSGGPAREMQKVATNVNELLEKFKEANPGVDISKITGPPTGDTLMDTIKAINNRNKEIDDANQIMAAGNSTDPTGKLVKRQFQRINLEDGIDGADMLMLHTLEKSKTPIMSQLGKTLVEHDDSLQQKQIDATLRGQNLDLLDSREGREATKKLAEMKAEAGDAADVITDVAEYMAGHIQRSAATMKAGKGNSITVPYEQMDDHLKAALNLGQEEEEKDRGGSYQQDYNGNITVRDKSGKIVSKLNLNILKQRITEQFHGSGTEKSVNAVTQKAIEETFRRTGLMDLNKFMNDEFKAKQSTEPRPAEFKKEYALPDGKIFTIDQIQRAAQKYGVSVEEYLRENNFK